MTKPLPTGPAAFSGVVSVSDPDGILTFRVPADWPTADLDDDRKGAIYVADPDDPDTHLSWWMTELEEPIRGEDLSDLRAGIEEGLASLDDYQAISGSDDTYDNLIKFERVFTYGAEPRHKRKSWYVYVDKWAIVFAYQGSDEAHYDYWQTMGDYAFATFNVADWLWFATDRDLGFQPSS